MTQEHVLAQEEQMNAARTKQHQGETYVDDRKCVELTANDVFSTYQVCS